jgi:hypothetical protein
LTTKRRHPVVFAIRGFDRPAQAIRSPPLRYRPRLVFVSLVDGEGGKGVGDNRQFAMNRKVSKTPSPTVKDLNFKVSPSFHRAFKAASTMSDLSMKELLEASLLAWIDANGAETLKAFLFKRD